MLAPNQPITSSYCNADRPQCAEVTLLHTHADRPRWFRALFGPGTLVLLRDTKTPERSPVLFTPSEWRQWLRGLHSWRPAADGRWRVGDHAFDRHEVVALVDGADNGEFAVR
jgi:hypothetical protein